MDGCAAETIWLTQTVEMEESKCLGAVKVWTCANIEPDVWIRGTRMIFKHMYTELINMHVCLCSSSCLSLKKGHDFSRLWSSGDMSCPLYFSLGNCSLSVLSLFFFLTQPAHVISTASCLVCSIMRYDEPSIMWSNPLKSQGEEKEMRQARSQTTDTFHYLLVNFWTQVL